MVMEIKIYLTKPIIWLKELYILLKFKYGSFDFKKMIEFNKQIEVLKNAYLSISIN